MLLSYLPKGLQELSTRRGAQKWTIKIKLQSHMKKSTILIGAICAVILALGQNAQALTFGDGDDLGQVLFGIPSGDAARTAYVNHLIDMAPGTSDSFSGQTFNRSTANPGPGFPNYP